MKQKEIQPESVLQIIKPDGNDLSRRKFLHTAAVAGMAAVTVPLAGMAQSGQAKKESRAVDPMEKILSRYGSEFGDLKQIG